MQGARKFDHTFLSPTASNNRLHLTPGSVVRLWHASRILLPITNYLEDAGCKKV